jgi:hypothetical protein
MARPRVHDQPGRLVENEEIVVFKKNIQRDRFRLVVVFLRWRLAQVDPISRVDEVARPGWFPV